MIITVNTIDIDYLTFYLELSYLIQFYYIITIKSCNYIHIKKLNNFIKIIFIFAYGIW